MRSKLICISDMIPQLPPNAFCNFSGCYCFSRGHENRGTLKPGSAMQGAGDTGYSTFVGRAPYQNMRDDRSITSSIKSGPQYKKLSSYKRLIQNILNFLHYKTNRTKNILTSLQHKRSHIKTS